MMSRARTLSPGRQGGRFFRDRGRRASRCPQPSGKTDEMAAMIQILCQFHYIDALKASSTGRYDVTPPPGAGTTVTTRFPAGRIVYTATKAANTTNAASSGSGG